MITDIAYNGHTFTNDDANIQSFTGAGLPDIRAAEEIKSQEDGAIPTGYRYGSRTFGWNGHIEAATAALYRTHRNAIMLALSMQNQPVEGNTMTFTLITGDVLTMRECRVIGNNFDFPSGEPSMIYNSYQVTFRSTFGFFEGTEHDDTQDVTVVSGGAAIPAAIPAALSGSSSSTNYGYYINNGNANAYPVFTISGPGTGFTITNRTNGQTCYIDYTLIAGQTIEVDTWHRTVRLDGDTNILIDFEGDFMHFEPMVTTTVAFTADSGDTADTELRVVYKDTYLNV